MKGKIKSLFSAIALGLALAMAPLAAVLADDLDISAFDVMDDSDSEDGAILELDDSEDSEDFDSEDVDSEDSDSEDVDSEDFDSEDSDGDLDDSDSEDDSEEDSDDMIEDVS